MVYDSKPHNTKKKAQYKNVIAFFILVDEHYHTMPQTILCFMHFSDVANTGNK